MLTFQIARPRLQSALTVNLKYTKNKSGLWDFLVLKKLRLQDNLVKIEIVRCNWLLKKNKIVTPVNYTNTLEDNINSLYFPAF